MLIGLASLAVAQPNRITSPIDDSRTVLVGGRKIRLANSSNDAGRVESGFPLAGITLTLARFASQQADLDQLLLAQQNPASPHFHQWLTPEQFADRFGASPGDLAQIQGWLRAQGFTLDYTARSRTYVSFSGTAQQVQSAFHTEIHRYRAGGQVHYANASDPSIPEALAGLVAVDVFIAQRAPAEKPVQSVQHARLTGAVGTHQHRDVIERHAQVAQAAKVDDVGAR